MDQYKQSLCGSYFGEDCKSEDDILRCIKHNRNYEYKLNNNGKLHSHYLKEIGCYEPAIILKKPYVTYLYWLFDGEIKDCLHPFMVVIEKGKHIICVINYYSLERIQQFQPINLNYLYSGNTDYVRYNKFVWGGEKYVVVDDPNIPSYTTSEVPAPYNRLDMSQFVTIAPDVICPLWLDEFGEGNELFKFKFED